MQAPSLDIIEEIDLHLIRKSGLLAVRQRYDNMENLMRSIQEQGLIQPIIVRHTDDGFEIVSGCRRFEACRRLRWKRIPAIVVELTDKDAFEVMLTENVQRESLNPIEEAKAFAKYIEEYGWGGESDLARKIGKSQEFVSHRMLLLKLPRAIQEKIITRELNASTARELIWLQDPEQQKLISEIILEEKLSSRAARELIAKHKTEPVRQHKRGEDREAFSVEFYGYTQTKEGVDPSVKVTTRTLLALKMCLTRLDAIIGTLDDDNKELKEFVMQQRFEVHQIVDRVLRARKSFEKRAMLYAPS